MILYEITSRYHRSNRLVPFKTSFNCNVSGSIHWEQTNGSSPNPSAFYPAVPSSRNQASPAAATGVRFVPSGAPLAARESPVEPPDGTLKRPQGDGQSNTAPRVPPTATSGAQNGKPGAPMPSPRPTPPNLTNGGDSGSPVKAATGQVNGHHPLPNVSWSFMWLVFASGPGKAIM